ncbi:MAG: bifunctional 5,10-methylenetetrahydrofolate dehydrogenase/5,10-methenyltetrahydrofolate cyclohydrolase [Bacteroidota bacterium]|nr:bifunctional 5,10-methylenetetrahydrofolate dehydrogenase/5,10-methenyltetrahydrofolate cyclohydrolase [Bacteroidota bacterium]
MELIDGKKVASELKLELKKQVAEMIDNDIPAPHLAAILVGDDPASHTYVNSKEKDCREVGFISSLYKHTEKITERELFEIIDFINNDEEIDGLIVQLPLPKHISESKVIQRINPAKDVDGFHPLNVGKMLKGLPTYLPATPYGIMQLIERYDIDTEGKNCVVLGRSDIVGTPMSILLSRKTNPGNCTVTLCHSRTRDLKKIAAEADILIAAIGSPGFVNADMVKKDAVVIDVGIHRVPAPERASGFKLAGDVQFEEVAKKCSYITPVPGGVGPMTRVGLLQNTFIAAKKEIYF